MRIGLIAPPWFQIPPSGYGGTELMIDGLAQGLRDAGHEVLLFCTGDSTCRVPRGWVLPQAATTQKASRSRSIIPELRQVIHAYKAVKGCDIIHDHTLIGPVYAERFDRLPVVTTNHRPFDEELSDLYQAMGDRVPIIAISRSQASRANVPIARVIHHGIDADDFPFGNTDGGYVLFLGRMSPEKGAKRAALVAAMTGSRLLIAARMRGPQERAYFEQEVQPLLSDRIEYVGEVGPRRKRELLVNARALLNPIRWPEPFGLVMIEALACGTPVLTFPEGAAVEIVDHGVTGFLCRDEEEMAARLDEVGRLDRRACRAAVEGYFSTRRMVAEHVELFEQILSGALASSS
ncbi:MAG: glycosyltransferase family 4 protein [Egibacteraceae bacterium]